MLGLTRDLQTFAKAAELYGAVVAQARQPAFYAECGIEDTPEGRYELIVLHLVLLLERLSGAGDARAELGRSVVETFVRDMDDSLREMGVGDLSVPKKVNKAAAGLYDRASEYRIAMRDAGNEHAGGRLQENIPGLSGRCAAASALATYVLQAMQHLAAFDGIDLNAGRVSFPQPEFGQLPRTKEGGAR